jgi:hypothetical protein
MGEKGCVKIPSPQENLRITEIRDLTGNQKIDFDVNDKGEAVFVAENVPSFGYKTFEITTAPGRMVSTLKEDSEKLKLKTKIFK